MNSLDNLVRPTDEDIDRIAVIIGPRLAQQLRRHARESLPNSDHYDHGEHIADLLTIIALVSRGIAASWR